MSIIDRCTFLCHLVYNITKWIKCVRHIIQEFVYKYILFKNVSFQITKHPSIFFFFLVEVLKLKSIYVSSNQIHIRKHHKVKSFVTLLRLTLFDIFYPIYLHTYILLVDKYFTNDTMKRFKKKKMKKLICLFEINSK